MDAQREDSSSKHCNHNLENLSSYVMGKFWMPLNSSTAVTWSSKKDSSTNWQTSRVHHRLLYLCFSLSKKKQRHLETTTSEELSFHPKWQDWLPGTPIITLLFFEWWFFVTCLQTITRTVSNAWHRVILHLCKCSPWLRVFDQLLTTCNYEFDLTFIYPPIGTVREGPKSWPWGITVEDAEQMTRLTTRHLTHGLYSTSHFLVMNLLVHI